MFKIHHFALQVKNLEKSMDFYQKVLGLEVISKVDAPLHGERYAFLGKKGEACLELLEDIREDKSVFKRAEVCHPYAPHVAFEVKGLEALIAECLEYGVAVAHGPLENERGTRWVYIADIDNNIVELVEHSS